MAGAWGGGGGGLTGAWGGGSSFHWPIEPGLFICETLGAG